MEYYHSYVGPPEPPAAVPQDSSSVASSTLTDNSHQQEGGVSHPLSCKECRASKVKCERVFPCARCIRLGFK